MAYIEPWPVCWNWEDCVTALIETKLHLIETAVCGGAETHFNSVNSEGGLAVTALVSAS